MRYLRLITVLLVLMALLCGVRASHAQIITSAGATAPASNTGSLGDVTAGGPNGTLSQFSINSQYNIKAPQFGASGSIQTMTCNTSSSDPTHLTSCTGGDFVKGQSVRVPSAGIATALSTPGQPTVTCTAGGTGGSCSSIVLTSAGTCSSVSNPTLVTLSNAAGATVEVGEAITVTGAGAAAADLVTTVAKRDVGTTQIQLASPCLTGVSNVNVTLGTVTYGYEIFAIDGEPNGSYTAVGTPQTVSMTAQAPVDFTSGTYPSARANVSWSAVTGASAYGVCKNVNGGAYSYYTSLTGTSIQDYGNFYPNSFAAGSQGFTCSGSTVPSDVFATITGATGSGTYTLAANTYQPKYNTIPNGGSNPMPSSMSQTLTGVVVQHDDTPALQTLYQVMLPLGGHALVYLPAGDYNFSPADFYGGKRSLNLGGLTDVVLEGDGWASKIHEAGGRCLPGVSNTQSSCAFIWDYCGYPTNQPGSINSNSRCVGGFGSTLTSYALLDPANAGSSVVTLATPANSSNFTVGNYATVWGGDGTYPGNLYQTIMDKIISINSTTGQIYLEEPLVHTYSAALPSPYSECAHCAGAPQMLQLPAGPMIDRLMVRNLWYEGTPTFIGGNAFANVSLDHIYAHTGKWWNSDGMKNVSITNNTVIEDATPSQAGLGIGSATASTRHLLATGNTYVGLNGIATQFCVEGSSDISWEHNIALTWAGLTDGNMGVSGVSLCLGGEVSRNPIHLAHTNMFGVFGWALPGPWVFTAHDNVITGDIQSIARAGGMGFPIQTSTITDFNNVDISRNSWRFDSDAARQPRTFGSIFGGSGSYIWSGASASIAATTTDFVANGQNGGQAALTTRTTAQQKVGANCVATNLKVQLTNAANANIPVITLEDGGSGTALTCSVDNVAPDTTTTCVDTTHSVTVNAVDLLDVSVANPASANATGILQVSFQLKC